MTDVVAVLQEPREFGFSPDSFVAAAEARWGDTAEQGPGVTSGGGIRVYVERPDESPFQVWLPDLRFFVATDGTLSQQLEVAELVQGLVGTNEPLWLMDQAGSGHLDVRPGMSTSDYVSRWVRHLPPERLANGDAQLTTWSSRGPLYRDAYRELFCGEPVHLKAEHFEVDLWADGLHVADGGEHLVLTMACLVDQPGFHSAYEGEGSGVLASDFVDELERYALVALDGTNPVGGVYVIASTEEATAFLSELIPVTFANICQAVGAPEGLAIPVSVKHKPFDPVMLRGRTEYAQHLSAREDISAEEAETVLGADDASIRQSFQLAHQR